MKRMIHATDDQRSRSNLIFWKYVLSEPKEGRLALIASCRHGQHQFADPDGVFVDISEGDSQEQNP